MTQQTLLIIKPDGIRRRLIGEIISRMERAGLEIIELHMGVPESGFWDLFYEGLDERIPIQSYKSQISFMSSGPVLCVVLEGDAAISRVRKLVGNTMPEDALPGTIRGDFGSTLPETICHASDCPRSFKREFNLVSSLLW